MTAPPHIRRPDGPPSPRTSRTSFADILSSSDPKVQALAFKEPKTYCNRPAIIFTKSEISALAEDFKYSLIGKFSQGRPKMDSIRKAFASFGLKGTYTVGLIDQNHIIITLKLEEDFVPLWMKAVLYIESYPMRLFRWTTNFHPKRESPFAPVWITLPYLPVHLFDKSALFSIANLVGRPLMIDEPTANVSRPSVARVCVEIDVSKPPINRVWIGKYEDGTDIKASSKGFWQKIEYESMPKYCSYCYHIGHTKISCLHKNEKEPRPPNEEKPLPNGISCSHKNEKEPRPPNEQKTRPGEISCLHKNENEEKPRPENSGMQKPKMQLPMLIQWQPPCCNSLKLNTDGSSSMGQRRAGGGGLIRDSSGGVVIAFCSCYDYNSALFSELAALEEGLKFCEELKFYGIEVETDSLPAIQLMKKRTAHWKLMRMVNSISVLLQHLGSSVTHVYREGNQAANWLACYASSNACRGYFTAEDVPEPLKPILKRDAKGELFIRGS